MTTGEDGPVVVRMRLTGVRDERFELASLREWFSRVPELRGGLSHEESDAFDGAMGGLSDVLVAALGSGGAMTVLISSLKAWLQARRSEISVEMVKPDGTKIVVRASGSVVNH